MKSFDDFLSTLSSKDQEAIMKQAMHALTKSGETFSEKDMKLVTIIAQTSGIFNREMLRLYHNWLSEQL